MKVIAPLFALLMLAACDSTTPEPKVTSGALPAGDQPISASADATAKPEDCDDKAKQKVEISETEVKLGGGDTGCSLE